MGQDGKIEPPEHVAKSIVKATMGKVTPESPEVERNVCGALLIGSLFQKAVFKAELRI